MGFPSLLPLVMSKMEEEGIKFHFTDGIALFCGGWKTAEGEKLSPKELRNRIKENFGIPDEHCRDLLAMNEINALFPECKGQYKHIPYFIQFYVLDEEMNPLPYGEYGRFAFLDPLANSYPGFIITGDRVKLLEHCPECDRPGPVLAPEISRLKGTEPKGCAEVTAKLLEETGG